VNIVVADLFRMEQRASIPLKSETSQTLREEAKATFCSGLDNAIRMRQEAERLQARFQARRVARDEHDAASQMLLVKMLLMKKANVTLNAENVALHKALAVARKESLDAEKLKAENEFFRAALTTLVLKHNTTATELANVVQKRKRGGDDADDCDLFVKKARRE